MAQDNQDAPPPPSQGASKADNCAHARRGDREAHRRRLVEHFDKDGDGKLNEEEKAAMDKFLEERRAKKEQHRREGHGRRPSREEMIKHFDKDGDGKLNDEERAEMVRAMRARRAEQAQQQKD